MKLKPLTSILVLIVFCSGSASSAATDDFLECLSQKFNSNYSSISGNIYTPINSSFSSILRFSIHNLRFASDSTPKPLVIITPDRESQIPPVILCAKQSGVQIRTRSGGHDFEGLSYVSHLPFLIIDLINLSEITVDVDEKTAWVEAGATVGALYYRIAEKSAVLGFPAGICPTLGVGGHFSGGGYGNLLRKYGLAADNIIDARVIDANGRILDRKSMGIHLFWAIRGGGGASFGVIVAWKLRLVDVPENVVVFRIDKSLDQNATRLINLWQYVAPWLTKDLLIKITVTRVNSKINVSFSSLFLGEIDLLLLIMRDRFPQLGLSKQHCIEMSWIQSVLYFANFPIDSPPEILLNRSQRAVGFFKGKSNILPSPIPKEAVKRMLKLFSEAEPSVQPELLIIPYGGRMDEISEDAIPFPHRSGSLYKVLHTVVWQEGDDHDSGEYVNWSRRLDDCFTPFLWYPRPAYLNYRDLDLGVNNVDGDTSYEEASVWGMRYFKYNFDRLVWVKTMVDPDNVFRNEQSIPPVHSRWAEYK